MDLQIQGLGFILYSPPAVAHIPEGSNYLQEHFWNPQDVVQHVTGGQLTGFCTGSPGDYQLRFHQGVPEEETLYAADHQLRVALQVHGGVICIRDLYDLMDWTPKCPTAQQLELPDGWYRLTVYSSTPDSGIVGDNQQIDLVFERTAEQPVMRWNDVPLLC